MSDPRISRNCSCTSAAAECHPTKNLTKGTRVFYPVFVDGAKLSMGDLHFSQGDGEITFCGAIEMGGFMDLHVDLVKAAWRPTA